MTHFVDIHVGIDEGDVVGGIRHCELVVMVRNITKMDVHDDHTELPERLMLWCAELWLSGAKGKQCKGWVIGCWYDVCTRDQNPLQEAHLSKHCSQDGSLCSK
jgi:hypothetical protein